MDGVKVRAMLIAASAMLLFVVPTPLSQAAHVRYRMDAAIELTGELYTTVWAVAVGDADNDGENELIANYDWYLSWVPSPIIPRLVFFEWDGSEYLEEASLNNVTLKWGLGSLEAPRAVTVADVDGDEDNDVTFAGLVNGSRGLYVFTWDGGEYVLLDSVAGGYIEAAVADGDGDGFPEVYAATEQTVTVFRWTGNELTPVDSIEETEWISFVKVANADDDDAPEVLLATGDLNLRAYEYVEGSGYVLEGSGTVDYGYLSKGMGIGDTDGDGLPEVLRVDYHRHMVLYAWDPGNESYVVEWSGETDSLDGDAVGHGEVGDVDADGTPEVLIGHHNAVGGNSILVYEHDNGTYVVDWNSGWLRMYTHVLGVGDSDNDGENELIQGTGSEGRVRVFSGVEDQPPFAMASLSSTTTHIGVSVTFDASASTDDFAIAAYEWDFGDGSDSSTEMVVSHAYAARGTYTVTLTIRDDAGQENQTSLEVEVVNRPPEADAGPDRTDYKRTAITLDGTGSYDLDGDPLSFHWEQVSGPPVGLSDPESAVTSFVPGHSGLHEFQLRVEDGAGGFDVDTMVVTVLNREPQIISATPSDSALRVSPNEPITFAVSATDADEDSLTHQWRLDAVLVAAQGSSLDLSFSDPGTYEVTVAVSDGETTVTRMWTVTVEAPPSQSPPLTLIVLPLLFLVSLLAVLLLHLVRRRW